ncbi:hypothetical protein BC829DRAFT_488872 [Chytridium lagenaria]|nr:hypothetical protein BC829DRAFT_488872 [Chytridium lagenaria]
MDTSHSQPPLLHYHHLNHNHHFRRTAWVASHLKLSKIEGAARWLGNNIKKEKCHFMRRRRPSSIPNVVVLGMPMIMEGSPHPHSSTTQTQSSVNLFPHASPHLTSTTSSHLTQNSPSSSSHHDLFHLLVPSAQASVAVSASPISPSSASPFQLQFPGSLTFRQRLYRRPTNSNHPDRLRSLTASSLLSASSTSSTASTDSENLAFITFQNLTQTSNEPLYPLFSQTPLSRSVLHLQLSTLPPFYLHRRPNPHPSPNPLPDHAFDALRGFVDIQIPPKSSPSSADPQAAKPSLSPNTTDTEAPTRGRKRQAPPPTPSSTSSTPSLTPNLFPCPDCPKSFPTRPKLRDHRRCHNRTRSHICPQPGCGKRFLRTQDLARHEATHLLPGEKRIDAAKRHARLSCGKRGDGREDEELSVMEEDLGGVSEE